MKVKEINIKNYKSLQDVTFKPSDLTVLIGPNASGKSNFANSLSFLSEVYSFGLETAVKRKGGYENIALRRKSRSRSAVEFSVSLVFDETIKSKRFYFYPTSKSGKGKLLLKHRFSFKAKSRDIKSDFMVAFEEFSVYDLKSKGEFLARIYRNENNEIVYEENKSTEFTKPLKESLDFLTDGSSRIGRQELFLSNLRYFSIQFLLSEEIREWQIFQFSSQQSRLSGVPTPNPQLSTDGENLPALVDWLKTHQKDKWEVVLSTMREVVESIEDITTDYLHNQRLGLFFHESGYGRPWTAEDVSDGTILTLAILCSTADPRSSLILIEELENSLHPWIIRVLVDSFRKLSKEKNIILTTHSPILIDMLEPKEIWTVSKPGTETKIEKLIDIAGDLEKNWKNGVYRISEYLDTGLVPQAIPGHN